ncbi:MAG TPA: ankyrin repeat domain-containing protein [Vicinamibacterales bacterium]|nr:ankyrin repeat domain-containing protein [Vicinamibacterales bacterium]
MNRYISTGCAVFLLLASFSAGAATSDVADAAQRGDGAAVRRLLAQKADVNVPQADGATALHWAVYREDVETVDALLKAGANAKAANQYGATPLSMAAENGNAAIVKRLLEAGASANERMANDDTALMMAARTGNVAVITLLLDHGADVNASEKTRGTTALMWAAAQGHVPAVKLLVDRGADVRAVSAPAWQDRPVRYAKATDPRPSQGRNQDLVVSQVGPRNTRARDGGGLTPLVFAVRANDLESVRILLAAGADVNQTTRYGWSPLLVATQNRYYQLASYLLDHGADPNLTNKGGWSPLYLAVDNRNIEGGDYPVPKADMDSLGFIEKVIAKGADVNWRVQESTWYRTVFTSQWVHEDGATAFWRASQSSDLAVMRLLLKHGADPNIATNVGVTPLQVAAGIGWVEGITYEWSKDANVEAVKLLLSLGNDPNAQAQTGRTALHGAGHKGASRVIQVLVDAGARLDLRDYGQSGNDAGGRLAFHRYLPVDYADGLIRIGTQSAIIQPEAGALLRKLMTERGMPVPPTGRSIESVCLAPELCDDLVAAEPEIKDLEAPELKDEEFQRKNQRRRAPTGPPAAPPAPRP